MKNLNYLQKRQIFGFSKKRIGGCQPQEDAFRRYQETIQESAPKIESTISSPNCSIQFLLNILLNSQKIELNDKFFFDTILEKVDENLHKIYRPQHMVLFGIAMGMGQNFSQDNPDIIKKFYAHCFGHRFLLAQEDKQALNQIF